MVSPNSFEPELFPGATFKVDDLKTSLTIFANGSATAAAPKVANMKVTFGQFHQHFTGEFFIRKCFFAKT